MVPVLQAAVAVLVLLIGSSAYAEPVKQLSHRDRLYDVTSVGTELYAVGHPGLLLRSRDGGKSFENVRAGQTDEALFSVSFNKKGQGAVVGRSGVVLTTLDQGKTWQKSVATLGEEHPTLFSVAVLDDGAIVAVGEFGAIARSEDHGKSWSRSTYAVAVEPPAKGHVSDASCVAAGTAHNENSDMVHEARLTDVTFLDGVHGLIVGEFGLVLRTEDGGRSFKRYNSCTENILYSVFATGSGKALAVGADGVIVESGDGGLSWAVRDSGTHEHLFGVWADEKRAVILGAAGTELVRSAGETFKTTDTGVHGWLIAASLDSNGQGVIVGSRGYVRRTEDGGKTQQRVFGE